MEEKKTSVKSNVSDNCNWKRYNFD